jgi:hypothetical protein
MGISINPAKGYVAIIFLKHFSNFTMNGNSIPQCFVRLIKPGSSKLVGKIREATSGV